MINNNRCCWDSLMLLFQLQLSLSFISGFWRWSSRIAGLWEGPSTRTVRFYCEGLQLSFPSVQQMQCESKLWLNQLILSFEKRALQLAFLPQTGGSSFALDKIKPVSSCFSPAEQVHHPVMKLRFAQRVDTNTLCKYLQEFLLNSRGYWETGIL